MTCEQAGWVTFKEYALRCKGYEQKERRDWEKRRWELFIQMQLMPFVKQTSKPRTPDRWLTFPWEKDVTADVPTEVTEQEVDRLNAIFAKRLK